MPVCLTVRINAEIAESFFLSKPNDWPKKVWYANSNAHKSL